MSDDRGPLSSPHPTDRTRRLDGLRRVGARRSPAGLAASPYAFPFNQQAGLSRVHWARDHPGVGLVNMNGRVYDQCSGAFFRRSERAVRCRSPELQPLQLRSQQPPTLHRSNGAFHLAAVRPSRQRRHPLGRGDTLRGNWTRMRSAHRLRVACLQHELRGLCRRQREPSRNGHVDELYRGRDRRRDWKRNRTSAGRQRRGSAGWWRHRSRSEHRDDGALCLVSGFL